MDPVTEMTQAFIIQWQRFRLSDARLLWIDTIPSMHHELKRLIRALEMAPSNRAPYLIFDAPFETPAQYYPTLVETMRRDYEILRKGLSQDGVVLGEILQVQDLRCDPEQLFATELGQIWERTKGQFEYLLILLLPSYIGNTDLWQTSLRRILPWLGAPMRFAITGSTEAAAINLSQSIAVRLCSACFNLSDKSLQQYLLEVAEKGFLNQPSKRASSEKERIKVRPSAIDSRASYLAENDAAEIRRSMAKAAVASAQDRPNEAIVALKHARAGFSRNGLRAHEAILLVAIGNTLLATEGAHKAVECYSEALSLTKDSSSPEVRLQVRFALASAHFRLQEYKQAALVYEKGAADALDCESLSMRLEGLRMAGTCHDLLGQSFEAIRCWQAALDAGVQMPTTEIGLTDVTKVGEALVRLYEQQGLFAQAKSAAEQICQLRERKKPTPGSLPS